LSFYQCLFFCNLQSFLGDHTKKILLLYNVQRKNRYFSCILTLKTGEFSRRFFKYYFNLALRMLKIAKITSSIDRHKIELFLVKIIILNSFLGIHYVILHAKKHLLYKGTKTLPPTVRFETLLNLKNFNRQLMLKKHLKIYQKLYNNCRLEN